MSDNLFPHWRARGVPTWMERAGLKKCNLAVTRMHIHARAIDRAVEDGIGQVVPMIIALGGDPAFCKDRVGAGAWKQVHHASLTENAARLKCMFMLGLRFEDVLVIKGNNARSAYQTGKHYGKAAMLYGFKSGDLLNAPIWWRDLQRMGREPDFNWSLGRIRREHDALAIELIQRKADPTPFAKPWFADIDGYIFSLLKSAQEFQIEGAQMRHCVGSYSQTARAGRTVIFSIQGRERATAEFPMSGPPQIKGFANSKVSADCRAAAAKAFTQYREAAT